MARTQRVQRGAVGPAGPPAQNVVITGPNFTAGETLEHTFVSVLFSEQQHEPGVLKYEWDGYHGFYLRPTGGTTPTAEPNDPLINSKNWLWWEPFTVGSGFVKIWSAETTNPIAEELLVALERHNLELKTQRVIPAGGATLCWIAWFLGAPYSQSSVWYSWVAWSLSAL